MTVGCDDGIMKGTCWVACFDLLGFRSRAYAYAQYRYADGIDGLSILAGEYIEKAVKSIEKELADQSQFRTVPWHYAHFSDTFILYASDDSHDSFETLSAAAGSFFHDRVLATKPLRGALTWGRFYADRARSIFLGPAFMEAHEYAEKQDWVGYVLTPRAVKILSQMVPPIAPPATYVEWDVPVKVQKPVSFCGRKVTRIGSERLFAFRIGDQGLMVRESIHNMRKEARNESKEEAECALRKAGIDPRDGSNKWRDNYKRYRSKYINTLLFMKRTRRCSRGDVGCAMHADIKVKDGRAKNHGLH